MGFLCVSFHRGRCRKTSVTYMVYLSVRHLLQYRPLNRNFNNACRRATGRPNINQPWCNHFPESAVALTNNKYTRQIQSLRRIACLFDLLAFASNQIENVFSFPALFVITTSFFSCTTSLFLLIHEFVRQSVSMTEACFQRGFGSK